MRRSCLFCLASLVLAGCGDETAAPAEPDIHLVALAGSGRITATSAGYAYPLIVRVLSADTAIPLRDQRVEFVVTGGGGSVSPAAVTSDRYGLASAQWTLGEDGPQALEVRSVSATGVTASLTFDAEVPVTPYRGEHINFYWKVNGSAATTACPDSAEVAIDVPGLIHTGAPCSLGHSMVPFADPGDYVFEASLTGGGRTSTVGGIHVTVIRGQAVTVDTIDFTF